MENIKDDPIGRFGAWLEEAKAHNAIVEPTAMTLATSTTLGVPSARMVLLKAHDAHGFVFYTNLESRKSVEIKQNSNVALCFYWAALEKQVRIEGVAEPVTGEEADAYYNSRALGSRIGAHASRQSQPLDSRETLMQRVAELEAIYSEINPPPRPVSWSGWRVVPHAIEFWHQSNFRLHDRFRYSRERDGWSCIRLYP